MLFCFLKYQSFNHFFLQSDYWNPDQRVRKRAVRRTQAEWHDRFGNVQGPDNRTINDTMTRQDEKGSVGYK